MSSLLEAFILIANRRLMHTLTFFRRCCCATRYVWYMPALPLVCRCLLARTWICVLSSKSCFHIGCFVSIFCNCCASYAMRKRTLYNDMSRYICCGGHCPCSGKMNEDQCPELCLCLETVCCFAQSVASTRFMIQDEMHLENTPCDNCLIVRTHTCT